MPAVELEPAAIVETASGEAFARFSERTIVVAVNVDRDSASVMQYTVKPRPYLQPLGALETPRAYERYRPVQLEVTLLGPAGLRHTRRVDVPYLCLSHPGGDPEHILGDTFQPHRTPVLVELPELPGFDRVDVAYYEVEKSEAARRELGEGDLDAATFRAAAGPFRYRDLAFARRGTDADAADADAAEAVPKGATVLWPEDFGDTETYLVYGDAAETDKRINIVMVPDGYTYAQKSVMEAHAASLVGQIRQASPHQEHDAFYNYILVYAYSLGSGADQCDCGITTENAMGAFFPDSNPSCGHGDNRCLLYSDSNNPCDFATVGNLVSAELRAPAHDFTVVLVNTDRYGGCASDRATYSAANALADGIGIHELGHSWGGLADEYGGSGCGVFASEVNTSKDAIDGAWPEWVDTIGPPVEGGQYFDQCLYRPRSACTMNWLEDPFCEVCTQHWALETFDHPRVKPTAPIESTTPELLVGTVPDAVVDFEVHTRLATGAGVTNEFHWTIDGPGYPAPTKVAMDTPTYSHTFTETGQYTLTCEVTADTNFIMPERYGSNRESVTWTIDVQDSPPAEVEGPIGFPNKILILWDPVPNVGYNVYRGTIADLPANYGTCFAANLPWTDSFTFDAAIPPAGTTWTYLVAGLSAAGEGSMGTDSSGTDRLNATPCP